MITCRCSVDVDCIVQCCVTVAMRAFGLAVASGECTTDCALNEDGSAYVVFGGLLVNAVAGSVWSGAYLTSSVCVGDDEHVVASDVYSAGNGSDTLGASVVVGFSSAVDRMCYVDGLARHDPCIVGAFDSDRMVELPEVVSIAVCDVGRAVRYIGLSVSRSGFGAFVS